jgi:hypothetical protein
MVLFNYSTKEITAKVVYYGPGLCGKTTNLQHVYDNLPGNIQRGRMLSLATKTDRTLFFDFLPIDLGTIRGMRTRVQLYTVPGQVFYNSTRKLVLKGADGIVFVADSQEKMKDANTESFRNLEENCIENGINLAETPLVLQFNKRDLPGVSSLEDLNNRLNKYNAPFYESVATTGIGVHETLKAITKLVLHSLREKYAGGEKEARRPAAAPRIAVAPPADDSLVLEEEAAAAAQPPPARAEAIAPAAPAADPRPAAAGLGGDLEAAFAEVEAEEEIEELELEEEAVGPAVPAPEPVIEGLLRRADAGPARRHESFADLGAELATEPPPAAAARAAAPLRLEEEDPLGLGGEATAGPSPVQLRVGTQEVEIPLRIDVGGEERRYRLRLRLSLTED